jgi:glycerol-3-phosphate dehydrogenase
VALEAASRGLRIGLIDKGDFASGTSGRSSRAVYGGLRYLAQGRIGLIRESLRERTRIARLVPHLIAPLPLLMPTRRGLDRVAAADGLAVYGVLDRGGGAVAGRRRVGAEEAARMTGGLVSGIGGYRFFETVTDDARLTLQIALHAASLGAFVANYVEVRELLGSGRVDGVAATDVITGETVELRARVAVNATGVWAADVARLAGRSPFRLRPSKGVHLVFHRAALPLRSGLIIRSVVAGAFQFLIPWGDRVYVGTTDTPYDGDFSNPAVDAEDAAIILESLNRAVPVTLSESDVVASWAGIRPLLAGGASATEDISRRHLVVESPPGLVTVTGGKLTTFGVMAADTIRVAMQAAGLWAEPRRQVMRVALFGSLDAAITTARSRASQLGLDPAVGERMARRYGDGWHTALDLVEDRPSLGDRLVDELPVVKVEAVMARRYEMALTDEDILVRRTRLATMDRRLADSIPPSALNE